MNTESMKTCTRCLGWVSKNYIPEVCENCTSGYIEYIDEKGKLVSIIPYLSSLNRLKNENKITFADYIKVLDEIHRKILNG